MSNLQTNNVIVDVNINGIDHKINIYPLKMKHRDKISDLLSISSQMSNGFNPIELTKSDLDKICNILSAYMEKELVEELDFAMYELFACVMKVNSDNIAFFINKAHENLEKKIQMKE